MNASLQTLDLPAIKLLAKPVLNHNGFTCTQYTLIPGADAELPVSQSQDDQMLIVLEGEVAVLGRGVTTLLKSGSALVVAPGKTIELTARTATPVRVLRVEIPPRQVVAPQIFHPEY